MFGVCEIISRKLITVEPYVGSGMFRAAHLFFFSVLFCYTYIVNGFVVLIHCFVRYCYLTFLCSSTIPFGLMNKVLNNIYNFFFYSGRDASHPEI
jgi:hypothetical protein